VSDDTPDVLLLGASIAGMEVMYRLRRLRRGEALRVTVVDRRQHHPYIPLVHEQLLGRTEFDMVMRTRELLDADPNVTWITGEVAALDPASNTVTLADGFQLRGRVVVVALGSLVSAPSWLSGREHLHDAKFDEQVRASKEALDALPDDARIVVVGGGISGVELAGELAHARPKTETILVHAGRRLMPHLDRPIGRAVRRHLEAQGVDVRLETRLTRATSRSVWLRSKKTPVATELRCDLAFWCGGLLPPPVLANLGLPRTDDGWIRVDPTLRAAPSVLGCGDAVRVVEGGETWPTMQRAIECLWQAGVVAKNVVALLEGRPPKKHVLRTDFFHGISMGARSMINYGPIGLELGPFAVWFRRFLMKQFFLRYRPR